MSHGGNGNDLNGKDGLNRRSFLQSTAAAASVAAGANMVFANETTDKKAPAAPEVDPEKLIWRNKSPEMAYERLGRTNYMCSRVVAGWAGDQALWRRMLSMGLNYFDTARGYGNSEEQLKPFLGRYRDKVWVTSKATSVAGYKKVDEELAKRYRAAMKEFVGQDEGNLLELHKKSLAKQKATGEEPDLQPAGKRAAELYTKKLDESLERLGTDHVDCYFLHGVEIPWLLSCTDLWEAYERVHKAGKVKHFGFSTHRHQKECLAAAIEANEKGPWQIDLIMVGVNPESFDNLKPELEALRKQDVGIIAMKTSGIKNRPVDGREKKFKELMGGKTFNEWERSKLWMLHLTEGLIDACIAAMKSTDEMEADLALPMVQVNAAAERELRTLVKYEMAGACHLCGDCDTACPEHIAVSDMIRYHAYIHQYNERDLARELYSMAGSDPAKVCSNCGKCEEICVSHVPVQDLLNRLSRDMA